MNKQNEETQEEPNMIQNKKEKGTTTEKEHYFKQPKTGGTITKHETYKKRKMWKIEKPILKKFVQSLKPKQKPWLMS